MLRFFARIRPGRVGLGDDLLDQAGAATVTLAMSWPAYLALSCGRGDPQPWREQVKVFRELYRERRDALVNTHFAEPGVHMLQMRAGGPGFQDPSQRILLALTQAGLTRDDSYRLVQRNAMKVWEQGKDFLAELLAELQRQHYENHFPAADFLIVEQAGSPIAGYFLALIALEFGVGLARGRNTYRLNDAVNSLSLGVMSQVVGLFTTLNQAFERVAMHGVRKQLLTEHAAMFLNCWLSEKASESNPWSASNMLGL